MQNKMLLPLLALFLGTFSVAHAAVYPQSRPTSPAQNEAGLLKGKSPRPTPAPIKQQWLGAIGKRDLLPRQEANLETCGWYNEDPNSAITCGSGSQCATFTDAIPLYFACCPTSAGVVTSCPYRSACANFGDSDNTNSGSAYYVVDATVLCGSLAPSCFTIANSDASGTTWSYQGCYSEYGYYYAAMYTTTPSSSPVPSSSPATEGFVSNSPATSQPADTTQSSSQQATTSQTASSSQPGKVTDSSQGATSTSSGATTTKGSHKGGSGPGKLGQLSYKPSTTSKSVTTTTNKSTNTSSPTHIGAIAGGTVGGVAALALIGAAVGYLIYRKKKQRVTPLPEVSQYGSSNSYGSPQQSYSSVPQGPYGQGGGYSR